MRRAWKRLAGRIDAMSVRERAMIGLAAAAVAYSFLDALLVSPVLVAQRDVDHELRQRQADVRTLGDQLRLLAQGRSQDPDAANRQRLAEANARLAALDRELQDQSRVLIAPERMRALLEKMLAGRPGLQLVELRSLPQATLSLPAAGASRPAAGAKPGAGGAAASRAPLYKHGVEVTLRGNYLDLLAYLRALEALPERLYWDRLQLSVGKHPMATMTLTLYTVSMDRGWLQV